MAPKHSFCLIPLTAPTHAPRNISYEVIGATSFYLRWLPPPDEHHNGVIQEYRAICIELATGREIILRTAGNETEVLFEGLHPAYLYNCTVAAVTVDEGPFSAHIGVMTEEAGWHFCLLPICHFIVTKS